MNILLVSTGGHIGGEETFTRNLAKHLIDRGHNVWVAPGGEVQKEDLRIHEVPVAELKTNGRGPIGILAGIGSIRHFVKSNAIDVVHCQAAGPAVMGGLAKLFGMATSERWLYHGHGIRPGTYRWLPYFLNRLDRTMVVSDYELIKFKTKGVKDQKIVRVHNGIDPNEFSFDHEGRLHYRKKVRSLLNVPSSDFLIGYIGRLSPEKGIDLLLPAFDIVHETLPESHLVVVGDGLLKYQLEKAAEMHPSRGRILFTGFRKDIPEILCALDLLVLPSYIETFSLTSLQAMASGIPVVASDVAGSPEQIISGYNGLLFESGNTKAFADAILELKHKGKATEMGSNGRDLVWSYLNLARMMDEIEFYYRN